MLNQLKAQQISDKGFQEEKKEEYNQIGEMNEKEESKKGIVNEEIVLITQKYISVYSEQEEKVKALRILLVLGRNKKIDSIE